MKWRDRMSPRLRMRSARKPEPWGHHLRGVTLPAAPLGGSPAPRQRGATLVTLVVLLKSLPPGQALLVESP